MPSYQDLKEFEVGRVGARARKVNIMNEIEHDARCSAHILVEQIGVDAAAERGENVMKAEIELGLVPNEVVVLEQKLRLFHLTPAQVLGIVFSYAKRRRRRRASAGGCCLTHLSCKAQLYSQTRLLYNLLF